MHVTIIDDLSRENHQKELTYLQTKFQELESSSLHISIVPENKYLCIRLDGFKATKNYLKDVLINEKFNQDLSKGYEDLFYSFRNYLTREYTSSIVCAFIVNDEISVVLNKDNSEDGKKVMKLCTLFTGVLSASVTNQVNTKNKNKPKIIAFDARPLILTKAEITEYVRYRYLLSKRYAYWKVLRLNNTKDVYEDSLKKNLDNAIQKIREIGKEDDALKIISTYKFFVTEKKDTPKYKKYSISDMTMFTDSLNTIFEDYLAYLHSTKITTGKNKYNLNGCK